MLWLINEMVAIFTVIIFMIIIKIKDGELPITLWILLCILFWILTITITILSCNPSFL